MSNKHMNKAATCCICLLDKSECETINLLYPYKIRVAHLGPIARHTSVCAHIECMANQVALRYITLVHGVTAGDKKGFAEAEAEIKTIRAKHFTFHGCHFVTGGDGDRQAIVRMLRRSLMACTTDQEKSLLPAIASCFFKPSFWLDTAGTPARSEFQAKCGKMMLKHIEDLFATPAMWARKGSRRVMCGELMGLFRDPAPISFAGAPPETMRAFADMVVPEGDEAPRRWSRRSRDSRGSRGSRGSRSSFTEEDAV